MLSKSSFLKPVLDTQWARTAARVVLSLVPAVLIGKFVGEGKWIYLVTIGALPVVVVWPVETALGVFAVLVPFDSMAVLGTGDSGTTLTWFAGAASAAILFFVGLASDRVHRPPRATLWWSLFVVWGAVSCLWAVDVEQAYRRLPTAGAYLLLYILSVSLRITTKERFWISVFSVFGGCVAALYVAKEFYQGVFYATTERASLVMGNQQTDPNGLAASLLLPFSLAIALFFSSPKWRGKAISCLAVSLLGFGILLTMSRGGALGLLVVCLIYLRRLKKWRALAPVFVLILLLAFIPQSFFQRFGEAAETGGAGRLGIWRVGLELLKHYWVVGSGINNFPVAYDAYAGSAPFFRGFGRASHNIYLGTWVELGIVGLALLLAAARSQFREARYAGLKFDLKFDPILVGSEAACWGIVVAGFFLDILWRKYFWLSWILLAISSQISHTVQPQGTTAVSIRTPSRIESSASARV